MTFEEWWKKEVDAWDTGVKTIAEEAYEVGVQDGINRMYLLYDICPECRVTGGRHQMDCGRGR